jgi:hypothetical protein
MSRSSAGVADRRVSNVRPSSRTQEGTLTLYRHQWIFITDTVDAIYRPNDWFPEAILDQLAEVVGNLPRVEVLSVRWFFMPNR